MNGSISWFIRYMASAVGIVMSILGYASLEPSGIIAFAAVVEAFVLCVHFSKQKPIKMNAQHVSRQNQGQRQPYSQVFHTSGAYPTVALAPLRTTGIRSRCWFSNTFW